MENTNNELLLAIRELFGKRPPGVFVMVEKLFGDLDRSLSSNGELPRDWENARRPLTEVKH
jgi:hypothetical protein